MKKFRKVNEILDVVTKYKSKFLNLYEIQYKSKLGNTKTWMVASRKGLEDYKKMLFKEEEIKIDAVLMVGYNEEKDALVLIREFRMPINDYIYSLPAGLIDPGEDLFKSAVREMEEETGLELYEIDEEQSCMKSFASVGMSDESMALLYGKVRGEFSSEFLEEAEIIEPVYVTREKAREIIKSDANIDIKAWLVLKEFAGI